MVAVLSLPAIIVSYLIVKHVADEQTAQLLAPTVPTAALAAIEYGSWRKQGPRARLEATVRGNYHRHPLVVGIYVVLALQVVQNGIGFLVGMGVASALAPYDVNDATQTQIVFATAPYVVVPLVALVMVFIARLASYRIRRFVLVWIAVALLLNVVVNVAQAVVVTGPDNLDISMSDLGDAGKWLGIVSGIYFVASIVGWLWARRTESNFVLGRAYRQLSPDNQAALVELALPEIAPAERSVAPPPEPRSAPRPALAAVPTKH